MTTLTLTQIAAIARFAFLKSHSHSIPEDQTAEMPFTQHQVHTYCALLNHRYGVSQAVAMESLHVLDVLPLPAYNDVMSHADDESEVHVHHLPGVMSEGPLEIPVIATPVVEEPAGEPVSDPVVNTDNVPADAVTETPAADVVDEAHADAAELAQRAEDPVAEQTAEQPVVKPVADILDQVMAIEERYSGEPEAKAAELPAESAAPEGTPVVDTPAPEPVAAPVEAPAAPAPAPAAPHKTVRKTVHRG